MAYGHAHGVSEDTSNTPLDLLKIDKRNTELLEKEEVEGTPFTIVKNEGLWYILLRKYRLTEGYERKEEALKEGNTINWNKILQVCIIVGKEVKNG